MPQVQEVVYSAKARASIKKGIDMIADAVKITLGPEGRNVVIKRKDRFHTITKDGVTVAKAIDLENENEDTGAKIIQEAADKTNEDSGDGTTVTSILTQAMVGAGFSAVDSGASPVFLKRGIEKAVDAVVKYLDKLAVPIKKYEMIKQVASISANDEEMGTHIANLFDKVGVDGVVSVEESKSLGYEEEFVKGMRWDRGLISPYMMTDPMRQRCEMEDVFILLTDRKIENDQEVIPWMEALNAKGFKKMLIVAEDVSGAALQALVLNGAKGRFLGAAVPVPVGGEMKIPSLEDLAALTGAEVIAESKGTTLEDVDLSKLGRARRVLATKDFSVIIDGKGAKKNVKQRIAIIRKELKEADEGWENVPVIEVSVEPEKEREWNIKDNNIYGE